MPPGSSSRTRFSWQRSTLDTALISLKDRVWRWMFFISVPASATFVGIVRIVGRKA
jgi:hypothetical protein